VGIFLSRVAMIGIVGPVLAARNVESTEAGWPPAGRDMCPGVLAWRKAVHK